MRCSMKHMGGEATKSWTGTTRHTADFFQRRKDHTGHVDGKEKLTCVANVRDEIG